jgi:membrane fusion protein (multidrug efflux system)
MRSKLIKRNSLLAILLIHFFSCKESPKENTSQQFVPEVNVVAADVRDIPLFSEYVGQTYGEKDVDVYSRVDGWVTGKFFKEGTKVQQDEVLYTIDDLPIKTKIEAASARVAQAETQLSKVESDYARVKPLAEMNALSKRELDAASAMVKAAKSELDIARAQLSTAQIELSYTKIKSPVSGIIGIGKVGVGDYVGKSAGSLNTVSSLGTVRVRFSVSEKEFLAFTRLQMKSDSVYGKGTGKIPVQLILSDGTNYEEKGYIDIANREIDASTGSMLLQAIFTNEQQLIRPGQYVKIRLQTSVLPKAVIVPQQAVNQLQSLYQVFVVNDSSKIVPRIVQASKRVGNNWVIQSGLKAGERVAVVGSMAVRPNSTIKPKAIDWNYDQQMGQ